MCSGKLQIVDVKETDLWLLNSNGDPDLLTGITLAERQSSGITKDSKEVM